MTQPLGNTNAEYPVALYAPAPTRFAEGKHFIDNNAIDPVARGVFGVSWSAESRWNQFQRLYAPETIEAVVNEWDKTTDELHRATMRGNVLRSPLMHNEYREAWRAAQGSNSPVHRVRTQRARILLTARPFAISRTYKTLVHHTTQFVKGVLREKKASIVDRSLFAASLAYAIDHPRETVHVYTLDGDVYTLFENVRRIFKRTKVFRQSDADSRVLLHDALNAYVDIIPYDATAYKTMRRPQLTDPQQSRKYRAV